MAGRAVVTIGFQHIGHAKDDFLLKPILLFTLCTFSANCIHIYTQYYSTCRTCNNESRVAWTEYGRTLDVYVVSCRYNMTWHDVTNWNCHIHSLCVFNMHEYVQINQVRPSQTVWIIYLINAQRGTCGCCALSRDNVSSCFDCASSLITLPHKTFNRD